jgi:hypothetical protein
MLDHALLWWSIGTQDLSGIASWQAKAWRKLQHNWHGKS